MGPRRSGGTATSQTGDSGCATGSPPRERGWGRGRPSRQGAWPGEDRAGPVEDTISAHRDQDFVLDDVAARRQAEDDFYAGLDPTTGELP